MKKILCTLLAALSVLCPCSYVHAYDSDDEDEESVDQFVRTWGISGYILWKAIDLAKENHYRYLKILSAEYELGNQVGSFTCYKEREPTGRIFRLEDEFIQITISCYNTMPEDTDYIDVENYKDIIHIFEDLEEDLSFRKEDGWLFREEDDRSFDQDDWTEEDDDWLNDEDNW